MPWGNRQHPDDSGHRNEYNFSPCPRCGKMITLAGYGRRSHINACLRRKIKYRGKVYPPAPEQAKERYAGVKAVLRLQLEANGYETRNGVLWEKHTPRQEKTITMDETTFEFFLCEHPLREGWWRKNYRYTYKNVEKLDLYVRS